MTQSDGTQQMFRAIINGQSSFRQELMARLDKMENRLDKKIDRVERNLTKRIDNLGKQLAYLEDDTPTREEFGKLEKRVEKIEPTTTPQL